MEQSQTQLPKRHNKRWLDTELDDLHREYELLEWRIQEIASHHARCVDAILYKLQQIDLIDTWLDARGYQDWARDLPEIGTWRWPDN